MADFVLSTPSRDTDEDIAPPSADVLESLRGNSDTPSSQEST